jgi:hypothetical protein
MDQRFLNKQNINVLYEILLQELKIDDKSIWIPQIKQIFTNNINFFLANAKFNNSLLELNKLFLKQTTIAINKLIPNLKNEPKKINILPDDINFPHKIEDIRNIRKDLFEEEFNLKKKEFDKTMKVETPNIINFLDNYTNEKIINMEQLLSDKILERDTQIETTNVESTNVESINVESTNVESMNVESINLESINVESINVESMNIIDINNLLENINSVEEIGFKKIKPEKNKDVITINFDEIILKNELNNENINENKKKKVNFLLKEYNEIIPEIKTTVYEEQKSIELPKDIPIGKLSSNYILDNSKNYIPTQFLPMNEFVKKINELNLKIDNLTQIVEQLSNLIQNKEG